MFADDSQIASASNDDKVLVETLNKDLMNIFYWIAANKLSLNASKTECKLIGSIKTLKVQKRFSS